MGLLAVLCAMIVGYAYVTDSNRVREQAEAYLERLVGGPAHVQRASLSLFEGLRLEGVTIRTPDAPAGSDLQDSVLFTARSVRIDYNPLHLLLGKISAQRIIAVDPHVRLTENVDQQTWNFQRLQRAQRPPDQTQPQFTPPEELPEILLRNAQVDYARLVDGELVPRGSVGIEAQLRPATSPEDEEQQLDSGAYRFAVQTRGLAGSEGQAGPRATGVINLHEGNVLARLDDVDFAALSDILPRAAAQWWRQHGISGRLDVPQIRLDWTELVSIVGPEGDLERVPRFRAVVRLDDAQMQGLPEEWLPVEEIALRREALRAVEAVMARTSSDGLRQALGQLADEVALRPLRLRDVSGSFVFTHTGLRINGLVGEFEGNRLRVDGIVDGYSPDAALSLVVQNADEAIVVPAQVNYISSLPHQVREIYERFVPMGRCRLRLELHRPAAIAGARPPRPIVTGYVDVLDGTFMLDRFPYPVRNARGRLLLRYDRQTQQDQLVIENLRGLGIDGGPNQDAQITVDGAVGPLTNYAGFDITVAGKNVASEPALVAALPEAARQTIANFDPAHHGKGAGVDGGPPPQLSFGGDFTAHVLRPPGPRQRWDYRVDLALRGMNGAFANFPYPLTGATAQVSVFPDHVEITGARLTRPLTMNRAHAPDAASDATHVQFAGRVDWGRRPGDGSSMSRRPIRVDLNVTGSDLPTDAALLGALPPEAVAQLAALGVGGSADVQAHVFTDELDELRWDVSLEVQDGLFWPETGMFNLSEAHGRVRVLPDRVELTNLTGRRGEGTVTIDGTVETGAGGMTDVRVAAQNVMLDAAIYDLLPRAAKDAWNWLRPAGSTDAQITYRGPTALFFGSEEERSLAAAESEPQYEVILRPQGASALPRAFPYDLQNVRGILRIVPGRIELQELTAEHPLGEGKPPATLSISGVGELAAGPDGGDVWNLTPQIAAAPLDEALLAALPRGLADTITSIKAAGTISAQFERLKITTHPEPVDETGAQSPADSPATQPADSTLDVQFGVKVTTPDASMDVGAPLANVQGTLDLSGSYALGELYELAGSFNAQRFAVRGRAGDGLRGTISLPPDSRTLSVDNITAQVAGGELAGSVRLVFGEADTDPARYSVEMAVREADVRKLVGEQPGKAADFAGRMTARLDVEGAFGDPASRHGRGEVIVQGQKLYDLPLVLGLLQVTNLALPLAEPFHEATAAFSIDGQKVVFDQIALSANEMKMTGQGTLNFETQKVDLSFTTSNGNWAAIPLLGDLVGVARNELLRIHVRGTLKSPEVSGSTLPTVTSTIDEVFRRD